MPQASWGQAISFLPWVSPHNATLYQASSEWIWMKRMREESVSPLVVRGQHSDPCQGLWILEEA